MSLLDQFRLTDKIAVVTGAGAGLGRATAAAFAEAGADVAVIARGAAGVEGTAKAVEAHGRRALALTGDLRDPEEPARLVARVMETFGRIDIWVNNAGGADDRNPYPLNETSEEHWRELMSLNVDAVWRCTKEASKVMADGGAIINMSSIMGVRPRGAGYGPYAISKAAVNQMTWIFAQELAPRGIRVNAIAPGPVPTETTMQHAATDVLEKMNASVPLGRVGRMDEVAMACLYLAAPASAWCTGEVLVLAGGL